MLEPKRTKHRKQQKMVRHLRGVETRGTALEMGDFGLRVMESGWVTARQIEAGRVAISRSVKRGGKLWIRVFPDKPITKKPAETRMGSGKGSPELWVAEIRAGKIIYEMTGVTREIAVAALALASSKLPVKTKFIARQGNLLD